MRRTPTARWMGVTGTIMMMVEQLGLAMIPPLPNSTPPRAFRIDLGDHQGNPRGHAEGRAVVDDRWRQRRRPAERTLRLMDAPALNRANSTSRKLSSASSWTVCGLPLNSMVLPALRRLARSLRRPTGKRRSGQQADELLPHCPGHTHDSYAHTARHDTPPS